MNNFLKSILGAVLVFASGCNRVAPESTREFSWPVMGTYGSLILHDGADDAALDTAKAAVEEVNAHVSAFDPNSDVSKINATSGTGQFVETRMHTRKVLEASMRYHAESDGAFNPLIGPLMEVWGFFRGGEKHEFPPASGVVVETLPLCDFEGLEVRSADGATRLWNPGMRLDFGAIAKGYAVDVAFERLVAAGYTNFIINIGGNMRCIGTPRKGSSAWKVAVRDPRLKLEAEPLGTLLLSGGMAVATSGNYEQFFELDGKRYTHIVDPRTGMPVSGMAQVTVVAQTAVEADALSTTCFVLGPKGSASILAQHSGSGAMFVAVDASGGISVTTLGDFMAWFSPGKAVSDEPR